MSTKKILVVDDEQNIRDIFQTFLHEMGYSVATAIDGLDALEKVAIEQYDLYIVDIYMPRMGGLELISRLKEIQPDAVIIVTTGYSGLDVDFRSIRQSAFMYLPKPIQPDELIRAVDAGLAQSRSSEPELNLSTEKEDAQEPDKKPELLLLRGFTTEQIYSFKSSGTLKEYKSGMSIPMDKEEGCMVVIERGFVNVYYNTDLVDSLKEGDVWGEETFIHPQAVFTTLRAQGDVVIRHFPRRKLIDFFTYNEKALTDRYTINLIQCMQVKWKRSIVRLALSGRNVPINEDVFDR
ncbi:MAG: response regulator [Candidatus Cloacimonetes bacterium]|nr:response regulator [Candidatus Cloacimonadota bacterium]